MENKQLSALGCIADLFVQTGFVPGFQLLRFGAIHQHSRVYRYQDISVELTLTHRYARPGAIPFLGWLFLVGPLDYDATARSSKGTILHVDTPEDGLDATRYLDDVHPVVKEGRFLVLTSDRSPLDERCRIALPQPTDPHDPPPP